MFIPLSPNDKKLFFLCSDEGSSLVLVPCLGGKGQDLIIDLEFTEKVLLFFACCLFFFKLPYYGVVYCSTICPNMIGPTCTHPSDYLLWWSIECRGLAWLLKGVSLIWCKCHSSFSAGWVYSMLLMFEVHWSWLHHYYYYYFCALWSFIFSQHPSHTTLMESFIVNHSLVELGSSYKLINTWCFVSSVFAVWEHVY